MSQLVHQLTRADRERIHRHFLQLGNEDRRLRFGTVLDDTGIRAYCDKLDFEQGALFGVFGASLELDGVAHLAQWPGAAEVGLSVLASARGTGVGSRLFDRAMLHARNSGVAELFMHCLRENAAIRHIAKRAGMRIVSEAGEADAYLELPLATPFTVGQELYEQQCALIDWTLMAQLDQVERIAREPAAPSRGALVAA
jgi:GNAT superfamily N-acetyltransferase